MEKFFYREILCKFVPDFQTWIGFLSTFFEQNQKNRKLRKFISFKLQLSQFWARSEELFFENLPPIFELESDFFQQFLSKIRKLENCENLFSLNFIWANFEQDLFSKKKASVAVGFWKKSPKISQISNLKSDFFLILQKKLRIFQNCENLFVLNFIWANFQQNQRTFFDR